MMNIRSRISEFDTPQQAAAYERWLQDKVERSLAADRPTIPYEEPMAEARAILAKKRKA